MEGNGGNSWWSRSNKIVSEWKSPDAAITLQPQLSEERNKAITLTSNDEHSESQRAVVTCAYHRVFLICLAVLGLFYPKNFLNCGGKWRIPIWIYSTCILLLMVANCVRVLATGFDYPISIGTQFFSQVTTITWLTVCTASYVMHYVMCFTDSAGISKYYKVFNAAVERMKPLGMDVSWKGTRILETTCLVVSFVWFVGNSAIMIPQFANPESRFFVEYLLRVRPGNGTNTASDLQAMSYVMNVHTFFAMGAWVFPVAYVIAISKQICTLLDTFNKKIEHMALFQQQELLSNIGSYRAVYHDIKQIVSHVDGYLKFTYGLHFVAYLGLSMLQLYLLVSYTELWRPENLPMLGGMVEWFIASVLIVLFEFMASCAIIRKASDCFEHLQLVSPSAGCCSNEQLTQLHLFLKCSEGGSGFTIFSSFLVSTDAVFAILGTWITYFLLILQFNSTPGTNG